MHDHGPEMNCQACYRGEPPQFRELPWWSFTVITIWGEFGVGRNSAGRPALWRWVRRGRAPRRRVQQHEGD